MRRRLRIMAGVYRQYWHVNVLTTLEYRENFLLWLAFTGVYHASSIVTLWIVLHRFPSLNGWTFADMAFLYGLWMLAHAIHNTFFHAVADVPDHVREGTFDRIMLRPLDGLFQVIATPGQVFPDELILAIIYVIGATIYGHVHVDAALVLLVPLVAIGGALIDLALDLIVATLSFWFVRVDALSFFVSQLEQEFTRYPIGIYAKGVRVLLAFVLPFAFMNYFPAVYFLNKSDDAFALPAWIGLLSPLVGLAFVAVAYAFWRFGLNRYQGSGS
jgi:ABC-2 type transport system permease protein